MLVYTVNLNENRGCGFRARKRSCLPLGYEQEGDGGRGISMRGRGSLEKWLKCSRYSEW